MSDEVRRAGSTSSILFVVLSYSVHLDLVNRSASSIPLYVNTLQRVLR